MNKWHIALALLITTAAFLYSLQPEQQETASPYHIFLKQFGKPIPDTAEFTYRSRIFKNYVEEMERHNSDPSNTWKIGVNQFSDLTKEEFIALYLGEKPMELKKAQNVKLPVKLSSNVGAVDVDWRNKGVITAIKNQGSCGSCWAFAATAAHESYQVQFKNQPKEISLSEQQLVDCSGTSPYFNEGCNGGYAVRAL